MRMMREDTIGVVAIAVSLAAAGCGGGSNSAAPTVPSPTTTAQGSSSKTGQVNLSEKYLDIVAPANQALDAWQKKNEENASPAQIAKDVAPVVAAFEEADNRLLRVNWPSSIAVDVKALVSADGELLGDLRGIGNQTAYTIGSWSTQTGRDAGRAGAAANIVRADLGLPPAATP